MRAAIMRQWALRVDDIPEPVPGEGQVLAKVLACGICGSDLHMLAHGAEQLTLADELQSDLPPDPLQPRRFVPERDVIMGHEFCCEVVDVGPGCSQLAVGDVVVSLPVAFDTGGVHAIGYSNTYNGGYAELMVLNELTSIKIPAGLPTTTAAMTEPLAVGVHAVAKSGIVPGEAAVVLGLGPVGLAVVAELRARGIGPIVGADFSSRRRALAEHLGADVVVDPRDTPAVEAWRRVDGVKRLVVFEAVGVPGMIDRAMRMAPRNARICVVGVCMQEDRIQPMVGIGRELEIRFALGYDPLEFGAALTSIAEGKIDLDPLVTAQVDIDGVPEAFRALGDPEEHAKILVVPHHG